MRQIPASVILSFPAPNYVDPETRGDALIVTNSIFISFVAIAMSARLYTRVFITKCFGLDDVLAILAFVSWSIFFEFGPQCWMTVVDTSANNCPDLRSRTHGHRYFGQ